MFKKYHYLTGEINKSAACYAATVNGELAGFTSVIHFPHPKVKNMKRLHRTVVLPDYQGIGLSMLLRNHVCADLKRKGLRITTTTNNPSMINLLKRSDHWTLKRSGRVASPKSDLMRSSASLNRITTSWEYK